MKSHVFLSSNSLWEMGNSVILFKDIEIESLFVGHGLYVLGWKTDELDPPDHLCLYSGYTARRLRRGLGNPETWATWKISGEKGNREKGLTFGGKRACLKLLPPLRRPVFHFTLYKIRVNWWNSRAAIIILFFPLFSVVNQFSRIFLLICSAKNTLTWFLEYSNCDYGCLGLVGASV